MTAPQLRQLTHKALDAKLGGYRAWAAQSTGEKAAVALILNRPDWLADMGYTITDAINRVDDDWLPHLATVARAIQRDEANDAYLAPGAQLNEYVWSEAGIKAVGLAAEKIAKEASES